MQGRQVAGERHLHLSKVTMEFDENPADEILAIPNHYQSTNAKYVPLGNATVTVGPTKVGQAVPNFANKKDQFDKPGVNLPDLKNAKLVSSKMEDGEEVEKITEARIRRQAYEITIAGKLRRGVVNTGDSGVVTYRPPEEFDTETIKAKFPDSGANWLDTDVKNQRFAELIQEWGKKSLIWVCTNEKGRIGPTFYSRSLKKISANSGHYQPTISEFHRAVMYMSPAWNADTEVLLFNSDADNWEYVPVNMFKGDPSGGGKYVAHPDQVK